MRLIDADALNLDYEVETADDWKTAHEIANVIKYAPTVDAVPVVRCRDCTYYTESYEGDFCSSTGAGMDEDGYCSDGERKATP